MSTVVIKSNDSASNTLMSYNFRNERSQVIFKGDPIQQITLNSAQSNLVFVVKGKKGNEVWNYIFPQRYALQLLSDTINQLPEGQKILRISEVSKDDKYLFFYTYNPHEIPFSPSSISRKQGTVWSYRDEILTPERIISGIAPSRHLYCYQFSNKAITDINYSGRKFMGYAGDYIMFSIKNDSSINDERNEELSSKICLLNLTNKNDFKTNVPPGSFSPSGKFLFYFDKTKNSFFTYDTRTGSLHNTTPDIHPYWKDYYDDYIGSDNAGDGREIWLNNDSDLIVADRYDLWLLDPKGINKPINLTNGYGKKNRVSFYSNLISRQEKLKKGSRLTLIAFNHNTKENGFYQITIGESIDPQLLNMSNSIFFTPKSTVIESGEIPQKAAKSDLWLVKKLSSRESPNYYTTKNFKNFRAISHVAPETEYVWHTNKLIYIDSVEDRQISGVLYRPSNFDSTKSYPVIFYYYEKMSDNLNTYYTPKMTMSLLNIPWFTSHGFLVFTPDIFYTIGKPGESALKWVLKGREAVIKLPYVDSTKIGLYGHSFGGYETNYIITHSNVFSAACSASGVSNLISEYGTISQGGYSLQKLVELGQVRLGQSLWENKKIYIENSPIFYLGNVSTPLLIMHTEKDDMAPMEQATQLFTGLWRLKKKCWMLLYKDQNHNLGDKESILDFDTRLLQFFDHYLKGKPAPLWMTKDNSKILLDPANGLEIDLTNQNRE